MNKPRITIVGSINMDLVFSTSRMPAVGETISGQEFHQIPGGKGANQAVAAVRQGADVTLIGRVGDDHFGDHLLACLIQDGVDISHVARQVNMATGVAGILVDGEGHNSIVITPGANQTLSVADIDADAAMIESAELLVCQLETSLSAVTRAIEIAQQSGVPVIFNPSPMQPLSAELLRMVDFLIVNETEASQLSGVKVQDRESAEFASVRLLERGVGVVLLTMGAHGVFIAEQGASKFIPAVAVEAVDTTAAGDTFTGAFAVGLARGLSVVDASVVAQYAAALTVTKFGAQTSIPLRHEVHQFMTSRGVNIKQYAKARHYEKNPFAQ
ncbi:ribokinase [Collimonas sp. OK307]|uniref:ribokinase n=1 Tax=Collimonas sp. OK307 TaxID=1801620 RepID=UPI0008E0CDE8|nr:ribokinase [Collimonas sp. OK307]SFI37900.1 ribokinase [Collimonas sp. OK307]